MFAVNSYVQVDDAGGTWYGQVTECVDPDTYLVRVGGSTEVVRVDSYQMRVHPTVLMMLQAIPAHEHPYRVGLEVEVTSAGLTPMHAKFNVNRRRLARSATRELNVSVLELQTEGADRGSLCIELNYGPLQLEEYTTAIFVNAQQKLYALLSITPRSSKLLPKQTNTRLWRLRHWIELYSESLTEAEKRYRVDISTASSEYKLSRKSFKMNQQTNLSLPYDTLVDMRVAKILFEGLPTEYAIYQKIVEATHASMSSVFNDQARLHRNVAALLAHAAFMKAKYLLHRMKWCKEKTVDKHHFHVMIKASPQDAIFTILSDDEVLVLLKHQQTLYKDLARTICALPALAMRKLKEADLVAEFQRSLGSMLVLRQRHGQQRLPSIDRDDVGSSVGDDVVRHFHPRPTNRIPIYTDADKTRYFVVIELRKATHPINANFQKSVPMIKLLHKLAQSV